MRKIEAVKSNDKIIGWRRAGVLFEVGDHVRLSKGVRGRDGLKTSIIHHVISDVEGGVYLQDPIDGFQSWNVDDLAKVTRKRHPYPLNLRQPKRS